jgi:hypothetical protein
LIRRITVMARHSLVNSSIGHQPELAAIMSLASMSSMIALFRSQSDAGAIVKPEAVSRPLAFSQRSVKKGLVRLDEVAVF